MNRNVWTRYLSMNLFSKYFVGNKYVFISIRYFVSKPSYIKAIPTEIAL